MQFLLSSMSVVYVLTTPMPEDGGENLTVKMLKILKNYEIPLKPNIWLRMPQARSSLFTQHKMNMDESIQVSCIIDKLPPSWKDFKHTLKYLKEELTLIELGSHLRIEESLKAHESDKTMGKNVDGPSVVNMVEHNNSSRHLKRDCKAGNVSNRANGSGTKGLGDGSFNPLKRMMMLHGGLTLEQLCMCVKIDAGSRPMSRYMMDLFFTWEMSQQPLCIDVVV
ncbi:hypothetical protein Tco_1169997 [Tanacetum coccineum]